MEFSRRTFLTYSAAGTLTLVLIEPGGVHRALAEGIPGGDLDPAQLRQFVTSLVVPATMPRSGRVRTPEGRADLYDISLRQFTQRMLPPEYRKTTVWGYGPVGPGSRRAPHHAPSMTIEADYGVPVRVRWINDLVDRRGRFLPHLLPVDPSLHWANPDLRPGHDGEARTDIRPALDGLAYVPPEKFTDSKTQYTTYQGPVPMVVHLHGAIGMEDHSDGYPEAWFLPDASDVPTSYATHGTWYEFFAAKWQATFGVPWASGEQIAQYPNTQRDSTLWYHDHVLGATRLNVYAGPAGFYLVRGGPQGEGKVRDDRTGRRAVLPSSVKGKGSSPTYEIPLVIQDRSFNADGSLFYPDTRAFFDGYSGPFAPETSVAPVWNPEFFGNTIIANGRTWPVQCVEQRRYRFRLLNGCGSRFLILDFSGIEGVRVHLIGNDGGFLREVHDLADDSLRLLLGPAERADILVDFSAVPRGRHVLGNVGPDSPYGGGVPGVDFDVADPATTGRVMAFNVVRARGKDRTTPPDHLVLPEVSEQDPAARVRRLALLEHMHELDDGDGGANEAPASALLGIVEERDGHLEATPRTWSDAVTENPGVGDTETWEIYNLTEDAHPVHVHQTAFEVIERREIEVEDSFVVEVKEPIGPFPAVERGLKDTVIAYPETVTRIRLTFTTPGQFVWHCHVLEHEDNEMMRPFRVGPMQASQPADGGHSH